MQPRQLPLDLKSVPALGREDFFVSECNQFAVHWIEEWPHAWHPFPALIIYGETGSGKTHLGEVWRHRADANLYTADEFKNLSDDNILSMKKNMVIDGLDALVGNRAEESKLFHLYNHFLQSGYFVLFLSRVSPERLNFVVGDVASRLRACPNAEISAPDDDVLVKVLGKRFYDQGYIVAEPALTYVVTRMERSWDAMDKLIHSAITAATAEKRQITLPLLKGLVGESIP